MDGRYGASAPVRDHLIDYMSLGLTTTDLAPSTMCRQSGYTTCAIPRGLGRKRRTPRNGQVRLSPLRTNRPNGTRVRAPRSTGRADSHAVAARR